MMTETQIETRVERVTDNLHREWMSGKLTDAEYFSEMRIIYRWAENQRVAAKQERHDMTTKHTPGPWTAQSRSVSDNSLVIKDKDYNEICEIVAREKRIIGPSNILHMSNADLIACAPEMLAALKKIYDALLVVDTSRIIGPCGQYAGDAIIDAIIDARKLIAKAEGREHD